MTKNFSFKSSKGDSLTFEAIAECPSSSQTSSVSVTETESEQTVEPSSQSESKDYCRLGTYIVDTGIETTFGGGLRLIKSEKQVAELQELFRHHVGTITPDLKEKAMQVTGLPWKPIYKWLFDQKHRNRILRRAIEDYGNRVPLLYEGPDYENPIRLFSVSRVSPKERARI